MEGEDDIIGGRIEEDEYIDPTLRSSVSSATPAPSTAPSTSASILNTFHIEDDSPDEDEPQTQTQTQPLSQRRKRNSELLPPPTQKKIKNSGVNIMDKIGDGIQAMAEAIGQPSETRESVTTSLQGQAQEKVQDDSRLTEEGQLLMIERFTDITVARTYLALKSKSLQLKFFKRQLQGEEGELFIDWEEDLFDS